MIHANSTAAFDSISTELDGRQRQVLSCFHGSGIALCDREVSRALHLEIYVVRPRITELIQAGYLFEVGSIKDPKTRRTVRICARLRQ